ncbi:S1 RNA-binding domain-containing protein [Bacillus cereus]|uniref:S1 RNA-binding domain-containing protein n=1 Tax=Bacillus cereus TaxID=1396 RepID=UPI000B4BC633|nr:S1 RNA-binding domain-containing protein [Bacillus cereus]
MPKIGDIVELKVVKILPGGAILSAGDKFDYFLPIKEAAEGYVNRMEDVVKAGSVIKARITRSKNHRGKISFQLSLALLDEEKYQKKIFEEKMQRFLKSSDDVQRQLRQNRERKQGGRKKKPLK